MTLTIRIDKTTQWSESQTNNPNTMNIDTTPDCECNSPSKIEIFSNVTNPENPGFGVVGNGGPVTVTWYLNGSEVAIVVDSAVGQDAFIGQHKQFRIHYKILN